MGTNWNKTKYQEVFLYCAGEGVVEQVAREAVEHSIAFISLSH